MDYTPLYSHCQGNLIMIQPLQKVPMDLAWTRAESNLTPQVAKDQLMLGYNIGYRIPDMILVIDVDPKNGGEDSFKRLPPDVRDLPITTITPSGGYHIYTTLPTHVLASQLRTTLKDNFPGIDFLHKGKQVVLPGSRLDQDRHYTMHPDAQLPPPHAPDSLIELLRRPTNSAPSRANTPSGYLTNSDLAKALIHLPVSRYQDNDTWLELLFASHHATAGDGLEAFLTWSLSDPAYSDQEENIRTRWDSATVSPDEVQVTIRTLMWEIRRHGEVPTWLRVRAGMIQDTENLFTPISSTPSEVNLVAPMQDAAKAVQAYLQKIDVEEDPFKLFPPIFLEILADSSLYESHRDLLLKKIAKKTGIAHAAMMKDAKALSNPATTAPSAPVGVGTQPVDDAQVPLRMAMFLIDKITKDCHDVAPVCIQGEWWLWNGAQWSNELTKDEVDQKATAVIQASGVVVTPRIVGDVSALASTRQAIRRTDLMSDDKLIRVYTPGKAVEFQRGTLQWVVKDHSAEHRNTAIIDAEYLPPGKYAPPEVWLNFLEQATTSIHAQRTLACAIIYAAGGTIPWLRKCFFFYGPKRSGKSTTLDLIEAMLGRHNCSALNIGQLGAKNGPAELVSKLANISNETISRKAFQDDIFKSLVSGESIMVEKKFKDPFTFRNVAKFFMAANGFPRVRDESEAVWDRIVLLAFPHSVPTALADHRLSTKLFAERHQILTWAMQIFAEEYAKDECRSIMDPDAAGVKDIQSWRTTNNPALEWINDRIVRTGERINDRITLAQAYQDYSTWCNREGHFRAAKNRFSAVINRNLPEQVKDGNGRTVYTGVKLEALEHFDAVADAVKN